MRIIDAATVGGFGYAAAIEAITAAVRSGLDPAVDPPRSVIDVPAGQLLLMPSAGSGAAGVKVVTVAPGNVRRGLARIHGSYLLLDGETLEPTAMLDGAALTALRTPAVSVAAVLPVLSARPLRLAVIGAGPQAVGHVSAFAAVRPLAATDYLVRDPFRAPFAALALGSAAARSALESADVVVCATSARAPVFDPAVVRTDAIVVAVGSHEPDARELDDTLLARATVVVEDVGTALREAGDVVLAIRAGAVTADDLVPMHAVVTGRTTPPVERPVVFKSVGMAWQDLVIARAIAAAGS